MNKFVTFLPIMLIIITWSSFTQQIQPSPNRESLRYYFFSKNDEESLKRKCDSLGIKQARFYLLLGKDTVLFTQANDSMKLFRPVIDKIYFIGKGIEENWISIGVNTYVTFKVFYKNNY